MSQATNKLPTYFVSHGGGPWPWMKDDMPFDLDELEKSLQDIPKQLGETPKAILVVSGHWEENDFTVQYSPNPPMIYDYGGFPEHTYQIQYSSPGAPGVAARVTELLNGAGITNREDVQRGYDHGMYAPLYVMYPNADVPILQLSIRRDYDPAAHIEVGRALAPLRDEGVLILGSGFSFHNLRIFGPQAEVPSREFDTWLTDAVVESDAKTRLEKLNDWENAPSARIAHPAADHLIPLMVAVGAAEDEKATRVYHEAVMGAIYSSSYRFG